MAELSIIQYVQASHYSEEISSIHTNIKKSCTLYRLNPVLKHGVLRIGRHLSKAALPKEFPVILPKHSHVSTLILRHIHKTLGHVGRNHILSELRKRFWIINANSAACKVITQCVVCRRNRPKVGELKMADLPPEKLVPDLPPLTNMGIDYFGPTDIKKRTNCIETLWSIVHMYDFQSYTSRNCAYH